jgi:voltage-gated potassium channel
MNGNPASQRVRSIWRILLIFTSLITVGTLGYVVIEGWSVLDALYMVMITLSTVGFREVGTLHPMGQLWTILLIVFGISLIGYAGISQIAQFLIEVPFLRNRAMLRRIRKMNDHYIICGYGRMGRVIAEEFRRRDQDVVVIEHDPEAVNILDEKDFTYIEGSAIDDENLRKANIKKAKGLVAVLATDADNLFVALSARQMSSDVFILTRCSENTTQDKMLAAGANKVVNPYEIGGYKMSQMVLSPHVDDFIEIVSRQRKLNLAIDQLRVFEKSELVGKKLMDTPIRSKYDTIVTAILDSSNEMQFNPSSNMVINSGDVLICIGDRENLESLDEIAKGRKSAYEEA